MRRATARGFTLIELMVGLTLGLLLSLVVAQLFSNTRQANRATEDAARVQESARFATELISRTVRIAGYRNNPTALSTDIFPAPDLALDGADGVGTACTDAPLAGSCTGAVSDTLIVRFQGGGAVSGTADSTILDCLGTAVAPDFAGTTKAYNKFSIAMGVDGRNALYCSNDSAVTPGTELVPGVEAMQIIFGEDTTADGAADRFIPIGSLTALTGLNNVVAVRVYLLLSGSENVRLDAAAAVYPVGGVTYNYTDQKIRRVVTTTVVLRNRAP